MLNSYGFFQLMKMKDIILNYYSDIEDFYKLIVNSINHQH